MTVKSSLSTTTIAVLSTVGSTAAMFAKTVDSAASSVDMLDRLVQRAKTRQLESHAIEDRNWRRNLILQAAESQEKIESDLDRKYTDPAKAKRFNEVIADLNTLFTPPAP